MQFLDWLVIGLFFIALIGIILWVMRQKPVSYTHLTLPTNSLV